MPRPNRFKKPKDMSIRPEEMPQNLVMGRGPNKWRLLEGYFSTESNTRVYDEALKNLEEARSGRVTDLETARKYAVAGNFFGMIRQRDRESGLKKHPEIGRKEVSAYLGAVRAYKIAMRTEADEGLAVIKMEYADVRLRLAKALRDSDLPGAVTNTEMAIKELRDAEAWYRLAGFKTIADEIAGLKLAASRTLADLQGIRE